MVQPIGWLFVFAGCFSLAGAVCDWDWFMNNRKTRAFVSMLGRTGARIFYAALGIGLAVLGLLVAFGVIQQNP